MTGEVVFLKFRSAQIEDDALSFLSCKPCRNKTFTLAYDGGEYPLMRCACCGHHIGRVGWASDDDEDGGVSTPSGA